MPKRRRSTRRRVSKRKAPTWYERAGAKAGSWVARQAAGLVKRVTGMGDYSVSGNTLLTDNAPALFGAGSGIGGGLRVCHREYIKDIYGSIDFDVEYFSINPSNSTLFPWLSQISANFDQYKFHGLIFEFNSTSADALNSTNTALGTLIMSTDYDVYDQPFSSKQQMNQNMFTCSGPPSNNMMHPIECNPSQNPTKLMYLSGGHSGQDMDQRFVDLGRFHIAKVGMQAAANVGELWVTYDVEFFKPHPSTSLAVSYCATYTIGNTYSIANMFDSEVVEDGSSSKVSVDYNSTPAGVITFDKSLAGKKFLVYLSILGDSTSAGNYGAVVAGMQESQSSTVPPGTVTTIGRSVRMKVWLDNDLTYDKTITFSQVPQLTNATSSALIIAEANEAQEGTGWAA